MISKTYEGSQGIGKTAQTLESFGEAQNQLNADILKEIRVMQVQINMLTRHLTEAQEEISRLKQEQVKYMLQLGQCQAELQSLQNQSKGKDKYQPQITELRKDVDRLKLTAKLNTNAIDRLSKAKEE